MLLTKLGYFAKASAAQRTFSTSSLYANGRFQSVTGVNICRYKLSPQHVVSLISYRMMTDPRHVLYLPMRQRFQHIVKGQYDPRQEGLWLGCTGITMTGTRVVRSWAKRRLYQAIVEALSIRGFDKKGKQLNKIAESRVGENVPTVLVGTLAVEAMPRSKEVKYKEVQEQALMIVDHVVKICGQI